MLDLDDNHSRLLRRTLMWAGFSIVIVFLLYRGVARMTVEATADCLERKAHVEQYLTRLAAVEGYARCVAKNEKRPAAGSGTPHPRCAYAGVWSSKRRDVEYFITLNADGTFVAEPGPGASSNAQPVTGAWTVANNKMVWAYDSGPVWPPDINPIFDERASALKLREVDGQTTELIRLPTEGALKC
ncbi:MAG: hypothetical protein JNM76_06280 [Betaproteobacteria bacterium]|nr:hypothetical protein [Betaproteobacteria bacterium]